jgi:hypothetical protein
MQQDLAVLPRRTGGYLMVSVQPLIQGAPRAPELINIVAFGPDGKIDASYGKAGRATVRLPFSTQAYVGSAIGLVVAGNGRDARIASSTGNGQGLKAFRIAQ